MYEYPYYGNQMYGQPGMQMQNPRMQYLQQQQNALQGQNALPGQMQQPQVQQYPANQAVQNPLNGRIVNTVEEITANDVPMNVPYSIFPKSDLSQIYVKSWNANGTIQTIAYKPIELENVQQGTNMPQTDFNALNEDVRALRQEIADRFDRLESSMVGSATKAAGSRTKKGDSNNE